MGESFLIEVAPSAFHLIPALSPAQSQSRTPGGEVKFFNATLILAERTPSTRQWMFNETSGQVGQPTSPRAALVSVWNVALSLSSAWAAAFTWRGRKRENEHHCLKEIKTLLQMALREGWSLALWQVCACFFFSLRGWHSLYLWSNLKIKLIITDKCSHYLFFLSYTFSQCVIFGY